MAYILTAELRLYPPVGPDEQKHRRKHPRVEIPLVSPCSDVQVGHVISEHGAYGILGDAGSRWKIGVLIKFGLLGRVLLAASPGEQIQSRSNQILSAAGKSPGYAFSRPLLCCLLRGNGNYDVMGGHS